MTLASQPASQSSKGLIPVLITAAVILFGAGGWSGAVYQELADHKDQAAHPRAQDRLQALEQSDATQKAQFVGIDRRLERILKLLERKGDRNP